jgi:putative FmdB family regulatory protein
MPIYEYRCTKCGDDFEEIASLNAPAPECPSCHSPRTEKLMSRACHRTGGFTHTAGDTTMPSRSSSSGCSGCAGGNCASCGG